MSYTKKYVPSGSVSVNPFSQHYYREWDSYLDQIKLYATGKDGTVGEIGKGGQTCFFFNVGFPTEMSKAKGWSNVCIQASNEEDDGLLTAEGLMPKKKLEEMNSNERLNVLEEYKKYIDNPKVKKEYDEEHIPDRLKPVDMNSKSFFIRINAENDQDLIIFMEKLNDKLYEKLYEIRDKWPECLSSLHKFKMINTLKTVLSLKKVKVGKDMAGITQSTAEQQFKPLFEKYAEHLEDGQIENFSLDSFNEMTKRGILSDSKLIPEDKKIDLKKKYYDRSFNVKIMKHTFDYEKYIFKKESLMQSLEDETITKEEYNEEIKKTVGMFDIKRYGGLKSDVFIEETDENGDVYHERGKLEDITPGCKLKLSFIVNYVYISKEAVMGTSLRLKAIVVKKPKKYSESTQEEDSRETEVALDFVNLKKRKRVDSKKEEEPAKKIIKPKKEIEEEKETEQEVQEPPKKKKKKNKKDTKKQKPQDEDDEDDAFLKEIGAF